MLSDSKLMAMAMEFHDENYASGDVKLAVEFAKLALKEDFRRAQRELRMAECHEKGHMFRFMGGRGDMSFVRQEGCNYIRSYVKNPGTCTRCGAKLIVQEEEF